jgi:ammonia channel protein AmtB
VAFFAPLLVVVGYKVMERLKLDDPKIVPLTLGPGIYSALVTALFATGVAQGGYFGLKGDYALQHAHINLGHQLVGVVVFVVGGLASALIVVLAVEKTLGLRDPRVDLTPAQLDAEIMGDVAYPDLALVPGDARDVRTPPAGEPDLGVAPA